VGAAVKIEGLTKRFGKVLALHEVGFEVPDGSLFGLLGPNGAGKTTLFSLAAGFLKPDAGRVEVLGIDVREISKLRGRFSMLPQDARFMGGVPVVDQLVLFCRLNGLDAKAARFAAEAALEVVGLGEHATRSAQALSHGMMARVALCQAFLGDPEVVFLDEPTSGLDPENARKMRELIRSMRGRRTVVVSSHNLAEIQDLCDHVAILDHGRLCECATMEELTSVGHLIRVRLAEPLPPEVTADLKALPVVTVLEKTSEEEFNLRLDLREISRQDAMRAIWDVLLSREIYPRSLFEGESLEARFLEITGGTYDGASST